MSISTVADVHQFLNAIPMFKDHGLKAARFTLDGIRKFCEILGNPEHQLKAIHVAGTNGKGTTCHMLASIFQEAGYKTGLYTSPHLERFQERVKINGVEIPDDALIVFFRTYEKDIVKLGLTYFEITTGLAFWYFCREITDIAIIETGLGGRLDATVVVNPLVSVITSIGLDHTDVLGKTITEIATEKAGIIKRNTPVVVGKICDEAKAAISKKATEEHADFFEANDLMPSWKGDGVEFESYHEEKKAFFRMDLINPINAINAAMAIKTIQLLPEVWKISTANIADGLIRVVQNTGFRARFERLRPDRDWFYDGAHNAEALQYTVETLKSLNLPRPWIFVFHVMKDKLSIEFQESVSEFDELFYFETNNNRAASFCDVKARMPDVTLFDAKPFLTRNKSIVVIFSGSFYFYSIIKGMSEIST
jgi:dihydrofolate synthase/folylpolyglutamate synthase